MGIEQEYLIIPNKQNKSNYKYEHYCNSDSNMHLGRKISNKHY